MTSEVKNRFIRKSFRFIDRLYALFQAKFLKRDLVVNNKISLGYGSNWFSIPENISKLLLDNVTEIELYFKNAICADELFLQTIVRENHISITNNNLRMIDWSRGSDAHPYIWRTEDCQILLKSSEDMIFARKFDESIDKKIIDLIYDFTVKK